MTRNHHDVVVVGGGPAGGTAAHELARRGMQLLVVEKERLPRYKPCAGGFPLKAAQLLDLDVSPVYEMEVTRGRCTYRGRSPVLIECSKVAGWTAMRDKLDYLILKEAVKGGAEVTDRQEVKEVEIRPHRAFVGTEGQEYSGLIVVGADGATGIVARCLGLMKQRRLMVTVSSEIPVSEKRLETEQGCVHFDFGTVPWGYGWIFPKKDHLSVGVGAYRGKATSLKACLFNLLRKLDLPSSLEEVKIRRHLIPLGDAGAVLHKERALLLGDAAGLADPITGEGIYYAIKSAKRPLRSSTAR